MVGEYGRRVVGHLGWSERGMNYENGDDDDDDDERVCVC